jgi:hypothetical protein
MLLGCMSKGLTSSVTEIRFLLRSDFAHANGVSLTENRSRQWRWRIAMKKIGKINKY